jgi:hypothetical protein
MLLFLVYLETDPHCPFTLSLEGLDSSPNSHGIISFADHHHLNSVISCLYKIMGGEGYPDPILSRQHFAPATPLDAILMYRSQVLQTKGLQLC